MRVFITVAKKWDLVFPMWRRVSMDLQGDCSCLKNLQKELEIVKQHVNTFVNQEGFALSDIDIKIEFN